MIKEESLDIIYYSSITKSNFDKELERDWFKWRLSHIIW